MQERTGGSKTVVNGQITDVVEPGHHPEGNRSRDANGRPRDARGRTIPADEPEAVKPAATPTTDTGRRRRDAAAD